ncbi:MAG: HAMP domain-containing histidine kinase [Muribaculaceae bacterium]|nr:HAMP domain-containing histidine kinase [Muribaculaceae bacterium]
MDNIEKNYEDFISTVSHELRTPLTSIRGFSQTILSSWDRLDDESKKKFIKIIEEQSNRLIHLVENMLSVTKLQSANNHFIYNEICIKSPIEQVIALVKTQYPSHKFEFEYKSSLPNIFVDKDKFQQIMTNLIENSAKYSTENSVTKISAAVEKDNVAIKVTNLGIGIDEKDYDKIFTKFARIDNPLTRKVQGSGLGLYITKNLTEKMGGEISVISIPTDTPGISEITFKLLLPVKTIEEQARIKCNQ